MSFSRAIPGLMQEAGRYLARHEDPHVAEIQSALMSFAGSPIIELVPQPHPSCGFLTEALRVADDLICQDLVDAIVEACPYLKWTTYDAYDRKEIGDRFPKAHAFASIVGSDGFVQAADWEFGLFLIAPHTFYRDHCHAAPELYLPLTGPHGWRFVPGEPIEYRPAHVPVWNDPWQPHATVVGRIPFLCLFCWTRDVNVPPKVMFASDWNMIETQA